MKRKKAMSLLLSGVMAFSCCAAFSPTAYAQGTEETGPDFFDLETVTIETEEFSLEQPFSAEDSSLAVEVKELKTLDAPEEAYGEAAPMADLPDLYVTNLRCHEDFSSPFATLKTVLFLGEVYNLGSTSSGSFTLKIYVDDQLQGSTTLSSLAPNKGRLIQINLQPETSGTHSIGIEVNPAGSGRVEESNYSNNIIAKQWPWKSISELYDVSVNSIGSSVGETIEVGERVEFEVVLANWGRPVADVPVEIYFGQGSESAKIFDSTFSLHTNKGTRIVFSGSFNKTGDAEVMVFLDGKTSPVLNEWNRFNNRKTQVFSVEPDTAGRLYGQLGLGYPLPSNYVWAFTNYNGHVGLDLSAPAGTPIYSVEDGSIEYVGDTASTGWFVAVKHHDINDPYKEAGNPLISRYLHILDGTIPDEIVQGARISRGDKIGGVGYEGYTPTAGQYYYHLHIDFNSSNIIHALQGTYPWASIEPRPFWPNVRFQPADAQHQYPVSTKEKISPQNFEEWSDNFFETGEYIDIEIVRYIGMDEYKAWKDRTPRDKRTIYQLAEDFEFTLEEFLEIFKNNISTYEMYMDYWPEDRMLPGERKPIQTDANGWTDGNFLDTGEYIDIEIVRYIGMDEYKAWKDRTPRDKRTIYQLAEDFDLTLEDLREILKNNISLYEKYAAHWPKEELPAQEDPNVTAARQWTDGSLEDGDYIDYKVIEYIGGEDVFYEWLDKTPHSCRNIYQLAEDFDLTQKQFKEIYKDNMEMYRIYMKYWPKDQLQAQEE